jgi:hypothetical protein
MTATANSRRDAMRQALLNKTQHSYETREDSGQFCSIFKDGTGAMYWKCVGGDHLVDIIPYKCGRFDPDKTLKPGDYTYVLVIWVHYGVGVNQDAFVCPAKNYGKPCPECEDRERIRKEEGFDEDLVKSLTPKKRAIYNVVVYDNEKESAKGVQVWDVAHWFMERLITPLAKAPSRGTKTVPFIPFTDPEEGKSISFERKGVGASNTTFIGHKFVDRDYIIGDDLLSQAKCLDEIIHQASYEEFHAAYFGATQESEEEGELTNDFPVGDVTEEEANLPPPPKRTIPTRKQTSKITPTPEHICPAGGEFGVDCEQLEACGECDREIWEACSTVSDKLAIDNQPKEAPVKPPVRPAPKQSTIQTPAQRSSQQQQPPQRPGLRQRVK